MRIGRRFVKRPYGGTDVGASRGRGKPLPYGPHPTFLRVGGRFLKRPYG